MCLTKLTNEKVPNTGYGYKVFMLVKESHTYLSPIYCDKQHVRSQKNTVSTLYMITAGSLEEYQTGYHIFLTKEDAEVYLEIIKELFSINQKLVVERVYYEDVLAVGEQDRFKCIVTKHMTIK